MIAEIIIIQKSGIIEPFPAFNAVMQILFLILWGALVISIVLGKK